MGMEDFKKLFDSFSSLKVGVIGDVMLDTYMWGRVDRISPEAPVPIISLYKKEYRIGGAGNVALNVQSLGAKPFIISVTGQDEDSENLKRLCLQREVDYNYSLQSKQRKTTNKIRIIGRSQQMMRLDDEITFDLNEEEVQSLISKFKEFVEKERPQVVIIEDYNKGVLTNVVIEEVLLVSKREGIITAVDPKQKNFFEYKEVDIFKPNLNEVKDALNFLFDDVQAHLLSNIHDRLSGKLNHNISLITLAEKGIFFQDKNIASIIPSRIRNIADVSGAGDTVIAVASMVYAVTKNAHLMAEVANIAGGLVCEEVGTAAINKEKLLHECELLLS